MASAPIWYKDLTLLFMACNSEDKKTYKIWLLYC